MALKLYGAALSPCTSRVMSCLHEKEADFELVPVDIFAGKHKHLPFLAKNPFGQIPVLEDGDLSLFESRVICTYVAEKFKEAGNDLIRHQNIKEAAEGKSPDQAIIDENMEKLGKVLDVYEDQLGRTKYLAGNFYSLADLFHLSFTYYFMKTPCANLINERPHVKAWWEDISSRLAFRKVASDMNFGQSGNSS
ncbi:Glutathione S-transferase F13 [Hibiscus syriacus]|uniref:glutathione transferase n=1 Tax=Hibiscus syriacus TaxID=106335 RepID=A0A6A2YQR5_HIBSY|nr:Glutathione S-transferase F13 [Hibiscus syriacus]